MWVPGLVAKDGQLLEVASLWGSNVTGPRMGKLMHGFVQGTAYNVPTILVLCVCRWAMWCQQSRLGLLVHRLVMKRWPASEALLATWRPQPCLPRQVRSIQRDSKGHLLHTETKSWRPPNSEYLRVSSFFLADVTWIVKPRDLDWWKTPKTLSAVLPALKSNSKWQPNRPSRTSQQSRSTSSWELHP